MNWCFFFNSKNVTQQTITHRNFQKPFKKFSKFWKFAQQTYIFKNVFIFFSRWNLHKKPFYWTKRIQLKNEKFWFLFWTFKFIFIRNNNTFKLFFKFFPHIFTTIFIDSVLLFNRIKKMESFVLVSLTSLHYFAKCQKIFEKKEKCFGNKTSSISGFRLSQCHWTFLLHSRNVDSNIEAFCRTKRWNKQKKFWPKRNPLSW